MLYAGEWDGYPFQIIGSTTGVRITLCSETDLNGDNGVMNTLLLNSATIKNLCRHVIATGTVNSKNASIQMFFGDMEMLRQLVLTITGSQLWQCAFSLDEFTGDTSNQGHVCTVTVCNPMINKFQKISGIDYTRSTKQSTHIQAMNEDEKFKQLQIGIYMQKLKSLEQLKLEYDGLTWYYNPDGSSKKDYRLITTLEDMQWLLSKLQDKSLEYISVDTEFSRINQSWHDAFPSRLFGMSISWEDNQAVYIIFESTKTASLNVYDQLPIVVDAINLPHHKIIAQNGTAEIKSCWVYSCLIRIDYDTLMTEFNLDIDLRDGPRDLNYLARMYFEDNILELKDLFGGKVIAELIPELDPEIIKIYACADTDYTRKIFFRQQQEINQDSPTLNIDNQITELLALSEFYGEHLDTKLRDVLREYNRRDLEKISYIAFKYIEEVGLRIQAATYLREEDITEENIREVLDNPIFIEDMKKLLTKDAVVAKGKPRKKLTLTSPDDKKIIYTVLRYPEVGHNKDTGNLTADNSALEDLLAYKTNVASDFLQGSVYSELLGTPEGNGLKSSELILLDKDKFDSYKYPFAYILQTYRSLSKKETGFFKRASNLDKDDSFPISWSRVGARTARVTSGVQTIDKPLKKVFIAYSDMYYRLVFDMNQIEFRVMLGLANNVWRKQIELMKRSGMHTEEEIQRYEAMDLGSVITGLDDPDNDYHREGGSKFVGTTPQKMTSAQRSEVKPVHFSVPFGADAYSLSAPKLRFAKSDAEITKILLKDEVLLNSWKQSMYPLFHFLEEIRDIALIQVPDSELPTRLKGHVVSKVVNALGRTRYFNLLPRLPKPREVEEVCARTGASNEVGLAIMKNKLAMTHRASIRREAGNFPIQSLAREIFFIGMAKLYRDLKKDKMVADKRDFFKVMLTLFVHDECGAQVHRQIHLFKMYCYIYKNCLMKIKGHPTYYMGISIVDNWLEGKKDDYESSIYFVRECIKKYLANPEFYDEEAYHITSTKLYAYECIKEHFVTRFCTEFGAMLEDCENDAEKAIEQFKSYYLMNKLKDLFKALPGDDSKSVISRIQLVFAINDGGNNSVVIGGKTPKQIYVENSEFIEECRPNHMKYVTEEDAFERGNITHIATVYSDGLTDASKDTGPEIDLSSLVATEQGFTDEFINDGIELDDAMLDAEDAVMPDFGSMQEFEESLEGLLDTGSDFTKETVFFKKMNEADLREDSKSDDKEQAEQYSSLINDDDDQVTEAFIRAYLESDEVIEEASKIDESYRTRVVVYKNIVTLLTTGIANSEITAALEYLGKFKTDSVNSYAVTINRKGNTTTLKTRVKPSFSPETLNFILNGVKIDESANK